jgi:hypothetical protein
VAGTALNIHQKRRAPGFERRQRSLTLRLLAVAMDGVRGMARIAQTLKQLLHRVPHAINVDY